MLQRFGFGLLLDIAPGGAGMRYVTGHLPGILILAIVIIAVVVLIKTLKKNRRANAAPPAPAQKTAEQPDEDRTDA